MRTAKAIAKHFVILIFITVFFALLVRAWVIRPRVDLQPLVAEEVFDLPVDLTYFPDQPQRWIVVEKTGKAKWFEEGDPAARGVVIDLSDRITTKFWEDGLLGVAIDPQFSTNRYVYFFYCVDKPLRNRVSRWRLDENFVADPNSELTIFEYAKPDVGHNGGRMIFDREGLLWISIGEGGAFNHDAKVLNLKSVLGKIIRIDVRGASSKQPHKIPPDNPFVGNKNGWREEIWASGFRNPWRFSMDRETEQLYVGDVGNLHREEINIVEKGKDYGFPTMEGELCHPNHIKECDKKDRELPQVAFDHNVNRSLIGGYVYRGAKLPWLRGKYIFSDYLRGIFMVDLNGPRKLITSMASRDLTLLFFKMPALFGPKRAQQTQSIVSFNEDHNGELVVADLQGTVYRMVPRPFLKSVTGFLYQVFTFR